MIREDLRGGGLNVKYYSWTKINFNKGTSIIFVVHLYSFNRKRESTELYFRWNFCTLISDFTVIFSIASCSATWDVFEQVQKERLLLIAITDPDCPRLPLHEALTIPRINVGIELPQIILDIRTSSSVNWRTATILYDDIFGLIQILI